MADKKFVVKNGLQSDDKVLINTSTDNNVDELQVNGSIRATGQIKSAVPNSGTAPFTVDSTTKVQNLNSDKLDDQEGSYYLDAANFTGTLPNDFVTLGTDTTGNYVATIADAGSSRITVANSGTESAAVTLDIANDAVTLGTHTTGNYVSGVSGTANQIDVTHVAGEGSTATIGLTDSVSITSNLTVGGELRGPATFTIDPAAVGDNTGEVVIKGDLTVEGTTTTVNSTEVDIGDNILRLNSGETGTPTQNAGLLIERGTSADVQFLWNETDDKWKVTENGTDFYNLLTANDTLITVTDGSNSTALTSGDTATFAATSGHLNVAESSGTITYSLPNSGVTAASYGSATAVPVITVDDQGRITSATTASISTSFIISGDSGADDTVSGGETLTFTGTANEITTTISANEVTFALPDDVTIGSDLTVTDDLIQGDHVYRSASLDGNTGTTGHTVASFSATTFASAELNIVAVRGSDRHITKMLVTHNGTTASATEFGEIVTSSAFASYDVAITSGNVVVTATQIGATSTDYRVSQVLTKN